MILTDVLPALTQAAQTVYAKIKQAEANQEQCQLMKKNIEIIMSSISQLEGREKKEQYQRGLDNLFGILIEAANVVTQYSRKEWWTKFTKVVTSKEVAEKFDDINHRLSEASQLLELGVVSQLAIDNEAAETARQNDKKDFDNKMAEFFETNKKYQEANLEHNQQLMLGVTELHQRLASVKGQLAQLQQLIPDNNNNNNHKVTKASINPQRLIAFANLEIKEKIHDSLTAVIATANLDNEIRIVKRVKGELDQEQQKRFEQEVKILNRLQKTHPRIVPLYAVCDESENKCLIMEYFPKGSLQNVVLKEVLTTEQKKKIARDIASALSFLHKNNVVHGNLESDHVFITDDVRAKLSTFKTSKVLESALTSIRSLSKSKENKKIAPETFSGHFLSDKSDIYSLGIVLLEVFSGQIYTPDKKIEDLLNACPKETIDFIKSCLVDDPEQRPTADVLIKQIENMQTLQLTAKEYFELGYSYEYGSGVAKEKNCHKAVNCYEKAVTLGGCDKAKLNLAVLYLKGFHGSLSSAIEAKRKAFELCSDPELATHPRAVFTKGIMLEQGDGVERDLSKALECYKEALKLYNRVQIKTDAQEKSVAASKLDVQRRITDIEKSMKEQTNTKGLK